MLFAPWEMSCWFKLSLVCIWSLNAASVFVFSPTTHFKINGLLTREMATLAKAFEIMRTFITQPPLVIVTLCEHGVLLGHHKETQSRVQFTVALRIWREHRSPFNADPGRQRKSRVLCSFTLVSPHRRGNRVDSGAERTRVSLMLLGRDSNTLWWLCNFSASVSARRLSESPL